jgi:hypothetical protein
MKNKSYERLTDLVDTGFEETSLNSLITRHLHKLVSDHPDFEVLCEPKADPYHFRYVPHTLAERQAEAEIQDLLDRLNEQIVESVQRIGLHPVITTRVQGRVVIQISCPSNGSSAWDAGGTFEAVARWGRLLHMKRSVTLATPDMEESYV